MFKSVRWRSEKNKISAVFKLTFHASQALQVGGSSLVLSVVPADSGKTTVKLEKCEIRDNCCYWLSPIFETVKFVQDPKNGRIHDRIYNFIISTGSSKSSTVGEASLNFSEYVEATKATSISLPFKGSSSDAVLHVSIQRIHENVSQRDVEESKNKAEDRSLKGQFGKCDSEENISANYNEEKLLPKPVMPCMVVLKGNGRASTGSDITLSGSDNSSVVDVPQELGITSNEIEPHCKPGAAGWDDSSTDDSTNSQRDASDDSVEKLKSDLILLSRKADIADLELQTLRKQIVKENRRGQDLLKEVAWFKDERDAFKEECERLKASQRAKNNMNYEGNPWDLVEEIRQELNHEKDCNSNLRLQLHKTQESNSELILAVQDLEQLLDQANRGDLDSSKEVVSCNISDKLEGRAQEEKAQISDEDDNEQKALEELVKEHSDAKEAYILEQKIIDLCSEIEMYRRDKDELEMQMEQLALDYEILKQENHDMSYKLEQSYLQLQLKLQYECSGSYATIHELENQVEKLQREIDNRSNELSESLVIIKDLENQTGSLRNELEKQADRFKTESEALACAKMENGLLKQQSKEHEAHIQSLEEELDKQAQGFESDLEGTTRAKVDQEQRAIRAEEALRVSKWKNANMAERLQDEFRRLSGQMQSTFDANEKVATTAMTEASRLRLMNKHLEELLQQARHELWSVKEDYEAQVLDLHKLLEAQREHSNERVKLVEGQITQKQVAMETSANVFLEKEKHLYNKIKESETKLEELGQTSVVPQEGDNKKVAGDIGHTITTINEDALLKEMASWREEKAFMEAELKEMQERYSEISLKFAEVEGERQRLVMTLRNVKNTKTIQR